MNLVSENVSYVQCQVNCELEQTDQGRNSLYQAMITQGHDRVGQGRRVIPCQLQGSEIGVIAIFPHGVDMPGGARVFSARNNVLLDYMPWRPRPPFPLPPRLAQVRARFRRKERLAEAGRFSDKEERLGGAGNGGGGGGGVDQGNRINYTAHERDARRSP